MNRGSLLALSAVLAASASGCAKAPPQLPREIALVMPTPPARMLIPVELPQYVEPEPEPVVAETPEPTPPRSTTNTRPTEKPPAPAAATPPPAPPVLRAAGTNDAAAQGIQRILGSAEQRLKSVNFRELNADGRMHYEQARDFIRMSNEQLSIKNYPLAEVLANRANVVAGLLGKS